MDTGTFPSRQSGVGNNQRLVGTVPVETILSTRVVRNLVALHKSHRLATPAPSRWLSMAEAKEVRLRLVLYRMFV